MKKTLIAIALALVLAQVSYGKGYSLLWDYPPDQMTPETRFNLYAERNGEVKKIGDHIGPVQIFAVPDAEIQPGKVTYTVTAIILVESPPSEPCVLQVPSSPTNLRLDPSSVGIANLSTRGEIGAGDNVLIGGVMLDGETRVAVRAIGPSLRQYGLNPPDATRLTLYNGNGVAIQSNEDWQSGPDAQELRDNSLGPVDPNESALIATLGKGSYTAIVAGRGQQATGVGMVEFYRL